MSLHFLAACPFIYFLTVWNDGNIGMPSNAVRAGEETDL